MKRRMALIGLFAYVSAPSVLRARQYAKDYGGPWQLEQLIIEQGWARMTPGATKTGAIYLTIYNDGETEDVLQSVTSSAASAVGIHRTVVEGGIAKMVPLPDGLRLPIQTDVSMRPGSTHVMLVGLNRSFAPGGTFPVQLSFRNAGLFAIDVPIHPLGVTPAVDHSSHDG
ncbi:MAG: copper chaperone PCu(A)C [Pseudomonadota bacterium]